MNYGDFPIEETIHVFFTTRAFATGIPGTLSAATVAVYEDITATPIETSIAVTESLNSIAGLNAVPIVAIAASGYEVGKNYHVVIEAGTVDSVSVVGEVIAYFSIGRSAAAVDLANGTDGLGALKTGIDGVPTTAEFNARTLVAASYFDPTADTVTTVTTVTNQLTPAEVESEVNDALVVLRLDHLVASADGDDPVDGSIMAHLVSATEDWSTFIPSTDSLQALRDRGDAAWTTGSGGSDRLLLADTTIATLATQVNFTLTAGSADNNAYNNCTIVVEDVSTATQKAIGMVLAYTGSTKTITLKEALAFTIATTDKVYILAENSLKSTIANRQLDVTATGAAGIDWSNVENPTTALDLSGTDIQLVDTTTTNTDMVGTDSALLAASINLTGGAVDTVTTLTGHTAQTGDSYTRLGAPAGASIAADLLVIDNFVDGIETAVITNAAGVDIAADIIAVKSETATIVTDTNEIQGKLPTSKFMGSSDGADDDGTLNTISTNVSNVETDTQDIQNRIPTALSGGNIKADVLALSGSTTAANKMEEGAEALAIGTVNDGSASTTAFIITLTGDTVDATDDHYNGRIITFTSGALLQQSTDITNYDGGTKTVTVTALTEAPANGVQFVIS